MSEPVTEAALHGIAAQVLNMAKLDMERERFNFLLAAYHEGESPPLHRMTKVEALLIERLGREWLNDWQAKQVGFSLLRSACEMMPPGAVAIVTACNMFSPARKFWGLTAEQQVELLDGGHDRHHAAVREGLMELADVLMAVVQTPELVVIYSQRVAHGEFIDRPEIKSSSQRDFGGRLKMFGEEDERRHEHN